MSSVRFKDVTTFNQEYGSTSLLSACCACYAMCLCGLHFSLFCIFGPPSILADRQTGASGMNWLSTGPLCGCAMFGPTGAES